MSLLISWLTLSYAIGKGVDLIQRRNPVITENVIPDFYQANNELYIPETGFRMAIAT